MQLASNLDPGWFGFLSFFQPSLFLPHFSCGCVSPLLVVVLGVYLADFFSHALCITHTFCSIMAITTKCGIIIGNIHLSIFTSTVWFLEGYFRYNYEAMSCQLLKTYYHHQIWREPNVCFSAVTDSQFWRSPFL